MSELTSAVSVPPWLLKAWVKFAVVHELAKNDSPKNA
jgi:hypothetical protein